MNLNPKHHNPVLLEQIDEYYDARYGSDGYDSCYYDSMWGDDGEYSEPDWIHYHWLTSLDRVTTIDENIKDLDGCRVCEEYGEIVEYEVYSHSSTNKTVGFFGVVLKAHNETKNPSKKLIQMHDVCIERYPEIYIRLLDIL